MTIQTVVQLHEKIKFTQNNLDVHLKAFDPEIWFDYLKPPIKGINYINTTLVNVSDIVFSKAKRENEPRAKSNKKYTEIHTDINHNGFDLKKEPIQLVELSAGEKIKLGYDLTDVKYKINNGRTRYTILTEKYNVQNVVAAVYSPMSDNSFRRFGLRNNQINKPFGQAIFEDVQHVANQCISELNGDTREEILESLDEFLSETLSSEKLTKGQLRILKNNIIAKRLNQEPPIHHHNGQGVEERAKELGIVDSAGIINKHITNDSHAIYKMIERIIADAEGKYAHIKDIFIWVHWGSGNETNPENDFLTNVLTIRNKFEKESTNFMSTMLNIDLLSEDALKELSSVSRKIPNRRGPKITIKGCFPMIPSLDYEFPMDTPIYFDDLEFDDNGKYIFKNKKTQPVKLSDMNKLVSEELKKPVKK